MKQLLHEWPATARESIWRHRDLRLIAPARAVSMAGDDIAVIALLLAAHDRGWGTSGVAAMLVASALPAAAGAPLAGRLVDSVDSRRLTVLGALWQGLCAAGLAVLLLAPDRGPLGFATVLALLFGLNAGQAVTGPAWQALVPHVVPASEVGRAVSALQATSTLAMVAGPAIGGVLVAWRGTAAALAVNAATFAAVGLAAWRVRGRRAPQHPEPGSTAAAPGLWAGYTLLRADALMGPLVVGLLAVVLSVQLVVVVEVFLVRDVLGAGPAGYGAVGATMASAMVAGSVVGGRVEGQGRQARTVVGAVALIAAAVLAGGLAPSLVVFALAMALLGLGNGLLNVTFMTLVLSRFADAVRGRVLAAVMGAIQGCAVLGMGLGGLVGGFATPREVFVGAGLVGLVVSAVVARALRGSFRTADAAVHG